MSAEPNAAFGPHGDAKLTISQPTELGIGLGSRPVLMFKSDGSVEYDDANEAARALVEALRPHLIALYNKQ